MPQINVSPEPAALETEPKQGSDSFQFELTQQDLADYVTVSDDANPIHTSPEYAQEFGYHAPLAQGMLMLGRVISHLESTLNHYSIPKQIQARFIAPVIVPPAGATIIVHTTKTDKRYEMALTQNDRRIVRASITLN